MADLRNEKITREKIEFGRRDVIGTTPSSIVYKGTFKEMNEYAIPIEGAVKRIPLDLVKLATNEIKGFLKRSDHNSDIWIDTCYITLQHCLCNLEEYVAKKDRLCLPNTPVEGILRGVVEGLAHIHKKNIIHRDIKPSNIFLVVKENKLVAQIRDFDISRFEPNYHTMLENLRAGTDVLAPPCSWRNDVHGSGLVVFYVLSKGEHLFDNDVKHIIKGNPVNLRELNGQPAALSLVKWLTASKREERPRMSEVVHHPFFWDDEKKLNFIRDVHHMTDDKKNALLIKEVIEEDSHHIICSSPENCGNQRIPPDPATCADWTTSLTPSVRADCPRDVKIKSFAGLVRIVRNKLTHFYGLKEAVKAEYGGNIEGFRRYWMERFPSLVVHLWEKVEITHLATLLRGYYAPESVRRRNVETTLIRAKDEGELGNPQELQNKFKRLGSKVCWERELRSAVGKGRKELVEVLLKDDTGTYTESEIFVITTLLCDAAGYGHVEIAQLLIERGAEVNCEMTFERTPLLEAAENGHSAVAQLLIDCGAEVNCKDNYGETPLHRAALFGRSAFAQLLMKHNAEINCRDIRGRTPLDYAVEKSHTELIELLRNHPAENLPSEPNTCSQPKRKRLE